MFADIDGNTLHYVSYGEGHPVVFIHGLDEFEAHDGSSLGFLEFRCHGPGRTNQGRQVRARRPGPTPPDRAVSLRTTTAVRVRADRQRPRGFTDLEESTDVRRHRR